MHAVMFMTMDSIEYRLRFGRLVYDDPHRHRQAHTHTLATLPLSSVVSVRIRKTHPPAGLGLGSLKKIVIGPTHLPRRG